MTSPAPTPAGPGGAQSRWARRLPPTPLARRLSIQSVLFAVGITRDTVLAGPTGPTGSTARPA